MTKKKKKKKKRRKIHLPTILFSMNLSTPLIFHRDYQGERARVQRGACEREIEQSEESNEYP